jgi:prefoldin subunit 5
MEKLTSEDLEKIRAKLDEIDKAKAELNETDETVHAKK